jgi:hypothetical protein
MIITSRGGQRLSGRARPAKRWPTPRLLSVHRDRVRRTWRVACRGRVCSRVRAARGGGRLLVPPLTSCG